ncbi:hypothetical protein DEU56DRAFT_762291 [Suillus clintonianus]|uniref:uncharacterized protein n=1 Tax=Suillus clintonianus TaxID=1904413 RepID=UPI001B860E3B|nr:uncharacterized protein DEU56DRAFT_762291 [Suillus clintonianus]KAG2110688.1 hypothetical protein DEU56DRAFT_762291 [Suillus clintonianus]
MATVAIAEYCVRVSTFANIVLRTGVPVLCFNDIVFSYNLIFGHMSGSKDPLFTRFNSAWVEVVLGPGHDWMGIEFGKGFPWAEGCMWLRADVYPSIAQEQLIHMKVGHMLAHDKSRKVVQILDLTDFCFLAGFAFVKKKSLGLRVVSGGVGGWHEWGHIENTMTYPTKYI